MNDPASLQNLNDIVVPGAAPWWPVAPGWYVLAGMVLVLAIYRLVRHWRNRRQNRYRRQALAELVSIRQDRSKASLQQLPDLTKRAALAVWPRELVAPLSGEKWHRFLDESAATSIFGEGAGKTLDWLAYEPGREPAPTEAATDQLLDAVEYWLKHHQYVEQAN